VKEKLAALVGVPLITPALERVRPAGIPLPTSVHVYGCNPPVAARETEYCPAKVASGKAGGVVIVKAGLTTTVNDCRAVCVGFVVAACTVKGKLPDVVGVPESEPEAEREMPGGRGPDPETNVHEGDGGPLATS
jgi:hypothetical protein